MHPTRRTFLKQCGLATVSTSLFTSWESFAASSGWVRSDLTLSSSDQAVLNFVGTYGSDIRIAGSSVLGRKRGKGGSVTRLLVRMANPESLSAVWSGTGLPTGGVYAEGNTFSFSQDGIDFQVENLLPDAAERRLESFRKGRGFAFAHDALQYRPEDGKVSDPLGARGTGVLKLNRTGRDLAEAFDNVLRGWIEAEQLDLRPGEAFLRLQKRVLKAAATRPALAEAIVRSLLQRLATLAETIEPEKVLKLFRSRIVNTALTIVLNVDSEELAALYEQLKPLLPDEFADSAIWLALVFGPELQTGAVNHAGSLESADRFTTLRSRLALARARDVVEQPAFLNSISA